MNACFKALKTNFPIAWRSPNAPAASRSFLNEITAAKAELAPRLKVVNRTKMTSSSNEQDWYVCMHVREQRQGRRSDVGSFWCVNISNPVYENNNSRLRLERIRLPPSQLKVKKRGREILIKNPVTNNVQRLQYKSDYRDVIATIGTKVYVMVGNEDNKESTGFQVYDFLHDSWRSLPSLPVSDRAPSFRHFVWGHKIGLRDLSLIEPSESHVFDTIEEKWLVPEVSLPPLTSAVEFSGFLIGMSHDRGYGKPISIVAYKIDDENGLPDPYSKHVLDDELWELFYPPLTVSQYGSSLHRFGDDRVVLVSSILPDINNIEHINNGRFVVMAVFRVSVSTVSGLSMINAVLEHKQVFNRAHDDDLQNYEVLDVRSCFLMQNAPSCCTSVSNMELKWDNQSLKEDKEEEECVAYTSEEEEEVVQQVQDDVDDVAAKTSTLVEWDEQLKDKSLYMCFVENRTDSSVSYTVKGIKFSDLVGLNPKLHQTASTSGDHLPCLPSCGLFGSLILFSGGGNQDSLRELEPIVDEPYSDDEYYEDVEVPQQAPINRNIYYYDVKSADRIIKRFPSSFKGMKPQPILAEVEGKLYALANSPMPKYMKYSSPCFEVFDPTKKQWSPLPDPPTYTKYPSTGKFHAIVGSNLLSWCGGYIDGTRCRLSPGVFRFDMATDKDWTLIRNSGVLSGVFGDNWTQQIVDYDGSSIAVDTADGDFIFFGYQNTRNRRNNINMQVHLISREFDDVVRLPNLVLPESVTCLLKPQNGGFSSFVHLGGQRVCLIVSSPFSGPYSRTVSQFGQVDKMSIVVLVFEFQVSEDRKSVAADFVFDQVLDYFDSNDDARRNPKTSAAHMVGAFLV